MTNFYKIDYIFENSKPNGNYLDIDGLSIERSFNLYGVLDEVNLNDLEYMYVIRIDSNIVGNTHSNKDLSPEYFSSDDLEEKVDSLYKSIKTQIYLQNNLSNKAISKKIII